MVVAAGGLKLPRLLRRPAGAQIDQMYRRYADEVFRYSLTVLRSRADAEDIVQTVFVRALRAVERGERVAKPRNWLIKIAHNECRRLLSSRKVHAELPDELAVEPIEGGSAEELRGALDALSAQQRRALVLRELEGRTYAEIADRLSLSVSAVETLIFRARRALREQLDGALGCDEFALLLDDPAVDRSRLRAHARVCESCAHLERQARGRKGALGRIASTLFPWWGTGAKVAAVALGTTVVAGGGFAVADPPRRHHHPNPVAGAAGTGFVTATPRTTVNVVPATATRLKSSAAHRAAAPLLRLPRHRAQTDPPQPAAAPAPSADPAQPSAPPATHEPSSTPVAAPAAPGPVPIVTTRPPALVTTTTPTVTVDPPTVTTPAVTVPTPVATVTVPSVTVPTATVPSVTVPTATVTTPTVTVEPVTTPIVTTPAVTVPSVTIPTPQLPNVSGP